jgi:hypothetical protein
VNLADDQARLVAVLVTGAPLACGFDAERVRIAREALLDKRRGEVAARWPVLAASLGPRWTMVFRDWAWDRAPGGALRDGWDLARHLSGAGRLPEAARAELAARQCCWHYDGVRPPRPRLLNRVGRWWRSTGPRWSVRPRRGG